MVPHTVLRVHSDVDSHRTVWTHVSVLLSTSQAVPRCFCDSNRHRDARAHTTAHHASFESQAFQPQRAFAQRRANPTITPRLATHMSEVSYPVDPHAYNTQSCSTPSCVLDVAAYPPPPPRFSRVLPLSSPANRDHALLFVRFPWLGPRCVLAPPAAAHARASASRRCLRQDLERITHHSRDQEMHIQEHDTHTESHTQNPLQTRPKLRWPHCTEPHTSTPAIACFSRPLRSLGNASKTISLGAPSD